MDRETDPTQPALSVLLVDDDVELGELLQEALKEHGMTVELAHDGHRGLSRALSGDHGLILLDVMLPLLDGFELLRRIRRQSNRPVIMLTARTTPIDQICGLDAGADDYLPKPFGVSLLLARIRAVLRRFGNRPTESSEIHIGPIRLVPSRREVLVNGKALELTSIEFDVFEYMARAVGRVVPRNELTLALFQRKASHLDRSLDTHIYNIRKKLDENADLIETIRGVGYLFRSADSSAEKE